MSWNIYTVPSWGLALVLSCPTSVVTVLSCASNHSLCWSIAAEWTGVICLSCVIFTVHSTSLALVSSCLPSVVTVLPYFPSWDHSPMLVDSCWVVGWYLLVLCYLHRPLVRPRISVVLPGSSCQTPVLLSAHRGEDSGSPDSAARNWPPFNPVWSPKCGCFLIDSWSSLSLR